MLYKLISLKSSRCWRFNQQSKHIYSANFAK